MIDECIILSSRWLIAILFADDSDSHLFHFGRWIIEVKYPLSVPDMKVVEDTQSICQIQGNVDPISPKKWTIHTTILQCIYPPCCSNIYYTHSYICKDDKNMRTRNVCKLEASGTLDDPYGINSLNVALLKEDLCTRGL